MKNIAIPKMPKRSSASKRRQKERRRAKKYELQNLQKGKDTRNPQVQPASNI